MMSLIMRGDSEMKRKILLEDVRSCRHGNEIISINVPFLLCTTVRFGAVSRSLNSW